MIISVPYWPHRTLRLHVFGVDDRRSDEEWEGYKERMARFDDKPRRRDRMPNARWFVGASTVRSDIRRRPIVPDGMTMAEYPAWRKLHPSPEREIGTILKGWFHVGWGRYRHLTWDAEFAVGGEDSMVQLGFSTPLGGATFGVKVPRRWISGWVYERRTILGVKLGYIGSIARIEVWFDDRYHDMADYYEREAARGECRLKRGQMRNGVGFYLGGTYVWEKQVVSRIFGKKVYTRVDGEPVAVKIPMPEGEYDGVVRLTTSTWKRPRAWWSLTASGTDMEVPKPPQFAGKGENSWDLDDDGYYGSYSTTAHTVQEAVDQYVASVLDRRSQYGMPASLRS